MKNLTALTSVRNAVHSFLQDKKGNMGMMAAGALTMLVGGTGLAIDTQRFHAHAAKAQSVADAAGLAASVYIAKYGAPPSAPPQEGDEEIENPAGVFYEGVEYSAADIGYQLESTEEINFTLTYDQVNNEVVVTTTGSVEPIIMQIAGKGEFQTSGISTVKWVDPVITKPASVLFVLDNSGSMAFDDILLDVEDFEDENATIAWANSVNNTDSYNQRMNAVDPRRDPNAQRRIDGLEDTLVDFNTKLAAIVGNNTSPGERFLRTGIIRFSDVILNYKSNAEYLDWGILAQSDINSLEANGATNSGFGMQEAKRDMIAGGENDPKNEMKEHIDETGADNASRYVILMSDGQNSGGDNLWIQQDDTGQWRRWYWWGHKDWDRNTDGAREGRTRPKRWWKWSEGYAVNSGDFLSEQNCDAMKADGIEIFTIGFALEPGYYFTNDWNNGKIIKVNKEDTDRARSILTHCADDLDHYLLASDTTELQIAFNQIQQKIADDIIRVRQ